MRENAQHKKPQIIDGAIREAMSQRWHDTEREKRHSCRRSIKTILLIELPSHISSVEQNSLAVAFLCFVNKQRKNMRSNALFAKGRHCEHVTDISGFAVWTPIIRWDREKIESRAVPSTVWNIRLVVSQNRIDDED